MQHEVGSIVEGKVTGITKFGAFVELEDGSVGMVHISEVSQSYVNDISEYLKEQQKVKVKVLNVGDDGKISRSIKRAMPQAPSPNVNSRPQFSKPASPSNNSRRFPPRQGGNRPVSSGRSGAAPAKENAFEDMLSKFMKSSDEKMSDIKQPERRRGYQKKDNRDYD